MLRIEPARDGDRAAIDQFLADRTETSMFFRSNLHRAGLAWDGGRFQAQYVLAWDGDALAGIVGHAWNGMMLVQAGDHAATLATAAVALSGRVVIGFTGPPAQVKEARRALGLDGAAAAIDHDETLMSLSLADLVVPPALAAGEVTARQAVAGDAAVVAPWRVGYECELNGAQPTAETEARVATWFANAVAERNLWLVEHAGELSAMTQFNARLPDCVQVGGVYTPSPRRGRGYARAAVAASLLDARADGVVRAILFTPRADAAAAYQAIGFRTIGSYAVVLLT